MNYIYALIDPNNDKVRYIGKSKNPKKRFYSHIRDAKKRKKTKKQLWILELIGKKTLPYIKIIAEHIDENEARIIEEKNVIKHIKTVYNIHLPGKGSSTVKFYKKNKTTCQKIRTYTT